MPLSRDPSTLRGRTGKPADGRVRGLEDVVSDDDLMTRQMSRRRLIKHGAVAGTAAIWLPPLMQSLRIPARAQTASPLPCGWMTGGGFVNVGGVTVNYNVLGHCTNPTIPPDKVSVSWTVGSGRSRIDYSFDLTSFATHSCDDTPNVNPEPPDDNLDTY